MADVEVIRESALLRDFRRRRVIEGEHILDAVALALERAKGVSRDDETRFDDRAYCDALVDLRQCFEGLIEQVVDERERDLT